VVGVGLGGVTARQVCDGSRPSGRTSCQQASKVVARPTPTPAAGRSSSRQPQRANDIVSHAAVPASEPDTRSSLGPHPTLTDHVGAPVQLLVDPLPGLLDQIWRQGSSGNAVKASSSAACGNRSANWPTIRASSPLQVHCPERVRPVESWFSTPPATTIRRSRGERSSRARNGSFLSTSTPTWSAPLATATLRPWIASRSPTSSRSWTSAPM
jgi:hypothetical protein